MKRIIFLNSYLPRTGHNFASEVIKIFSEHEVLAHSRSETRLSTLLNSYYSIYDNNIFHQSDKVFFDELFIKGLREKILNNSGKEFIMIKDTSLVGVDALIRVFPEDIHFMLIRDPKKVFLSLVKGMRINKKTKKNRLKKWGIRTGLYPYYYSKKLSKQVLKTFPKSQSVVQIRYEDLVRKEKETLLSLKNRFQSPKSLNQIIDEIDQISVINSSYFKEVGAQKIWDIKPKTSDFNPLDRKGHNLIVRKAIEFGSKKLRRKLGYIK